MNFVITARPPEWTEGYDDQWLDSLYGFVINFDPEEAPESRFEACWGEYENSFHSSLELAKQWCQDEVDGWCRDHVIVSPEKAGPVTQ